MSVFINKTVNAVRLHVLRRQEQPCSLSSHPNLGKIKLTITSAVRFKIKGD